MLGSELYAFCDGLDIGLAYSVALQPALGKRIPVRMYTDSKSLFDTITKRSQTSEKRLLIDLATVREAYRKKEIDNIAWIRSECNLADGMTKEKRKECLSRVLEKGILDHPVEQWIIRINPDKKEFSRKRKM